MSAVQPTAASQQPSWSLSRLPIIPPAGRDRREPNAGWAAKPLVMKTTVVDLVCGMDVDETTALHTEHEGASYYFCSERCRQTFRRNPEEFIAHADEHDHSDPATGHAGGGSEKTRKKGRGAKWTDYIPLLV